MAVEAFSRIPVIDLADIRSPDSTTRKSLAREIKRACTDVGFFYVKNHGISERTIEAVISASRLFFSLPEEAKLRVSEVFVFLCFDLWCWHPLLGPLPFLAGHSQKSRIQRIPASYEQQQ